MSLLLHVPFLVEALTAGLQLHHFRAKSQRKLVLRRQDGREIPLRGPRETLTFFELQQRLVQSLLNARNMRKTVRVHDTAGKMEHADAGDRLLRRRLRVPCINEVSASAGTVDRAL